jgi:light-regulated signal transduction histidine kinase (bacteriophytochrome)
MDHRLQEAPVPRGAELQFHRLLDRLPAAAYTCDAGGLISYFNRRAVELWGREPKLNDPVDRFCGSFRLFKPDGSPIPHEACWMALALRNEREYNGCEIVIECPDGSRRTAVAYANPMHDSQGQISGAVNVLMDITERKRSEELVSKQARDLERSNAELQQFAYAASHDLQEPLRMVTSYVQLLQKRLQGSLDPETQEFMGHVIDGSRRMSRLIGDLLEYAQVESRAETTGEIALDEVLSSVVRQLAPAIERSGAEVNAAELPRLRVSRGHLEQLFANLIGNAIKFRGTEPPRIRIDATRKGGSWELSVADNGIGIAAEYFEKVFVLFQRLHSQSQYPGTGIGLAICKKIVERYGGEIWIDSAPGCGATFRFTLPG